MADHSSDQAETQNPMDYDKESVMKKTLVISAVNIVEAGTLTILRNAIDSGVANLGKEWRIIALVNSKDLIKNSIIRIIEFPKAKRMWIIRLAYEWVIFNLLSKELKPDLWLSLHDITPIVRSRRQAVYCHNPSPFYRLTFREALEEPKFLLFNLFYSKLYALGIKKNAYVIVQQEWLREEFKKRYSLNSVIVAHPDIRKESYKSADTCASVPMFIYPAFPRIFKNFEAICEATIILHSEGYHDFNVLLTISGDETSYSKRIYKMYSKVCAIQFVGRQTSGDLTVLYKQSKAVIFPSKLETWGLPITEAIAFKKIILAANLPYAYETVGEYGDVAYFDPQNPKALAELMQSVIENRWVPKPAPFVKPSEPFAEGWADLWPLLTKDL